MPVILRCLIVLIIGLAIWRPTTASKVDELGRIMFFVGLLASVWVLMALRVL